MKKKLECPSELHKTNRRTFLKRTSAMVSFMVVPRHVLGGEGYTPPSDKLNIAGIGVGGQGAGDLNEMASENIVALCDVDWERAGGTFNRFPKAKRYRDFREMLEKQKDIEAVMIATPDHMHAPAGAMAMRMGMHAYIEKPMAHTIYEARLLTKIAREKKVVTQMGNNGHAGEGLRLTYEFIHDGAIGDVYEVHSWSDRPIGWWPQEQGLVRPSDTPPVPEKLDWNLWLGPAPERPYHPAYVPVKWRAWYDFGCGAMGDMAVHNVDPAFFCLGLGAPYAAEAETSGVEKETFPAWQIITYYFKDSKGREVKLKWYDGKKMPPKPEGFEPGRRLADNGIIFVGDKGSMICGGWSGPPRLIPETRMKDYSRPDKTLARSIGHRQEWIQACKDKKPAAAMAGFEYSGPFTEALLVGNLAVRLGKRIEWDSQKMKATNAPEADILINKLYRKGWEL